jgi:hypothetical protein
MSVVGQKNSICRWSSPYTPSDGESTEQLVPQALALSNSRQTTVLDLFGVQFQTVLGELEPLLNERGKFTNPSSFITKDFLGVGGSNDDLFNVSKSVCKGKTPWLRNALRYERALLGLHILSNLPLLIHE